MFDMTPLTENYVCSAPMSKEFEKHTLYCNNLKKNAK